MMTRQPPRPIPPAAAAARPAAQPSAPSARKPTPGNRADDLMATIRQLSDLLARENTALKRHRTDEVKTLTERKEQLARLYQQQMNALHREPEIAKTMDPAKRNALAQMAIRLSELMGENASLLKANITVINKFLKTVVDAVREKQRETAAAYSSNGALNAYVPSKRHLAVSFNQTM
jgi:hypothetical protein